MPWFQQAVTEEFIVKPSSDEAPGSSSKTLVTILTPFRYGKPMLEPDA